MIYCKPWITARAVFKRRAPPKLVRPFPRPLTLKVHISYPSCPRGARPDHASEFRPDGSKYMNALILSNVSATTLAYPRVPLPPSPVHRTDARVAQSPRSSKTTATPFRPRKFSPETVASTPPTAPKHVRSRGCGARARTSRAQN